MEQKVFIVSDGQRSKDWVSHRESEIMHLFLRWGSPARLTSLRPGLPIPWAFFHRLSQADRGHQGGSILLQGLLRVRRQAIITLARAYLVEVQGSLTKPVEDTIHAKRSPSLDCRYGLIYLETFK